MMFTNRPNTKKPDEELINKFQATFSDVVRPTPSYNFPTGAAPNVHNTASLDGLSLVRAASVRRQDGLDRTLNATSTVSHSPAGDLLTPSHGHHAMLDQMLFDQFVDNSPHTQSHKVCLDGIDGQRYPSQQPQDLSTRPPNVYYQPQDFILPRPPSGHVRGEIGLCPQKVNKEDSLSSHTASKIHVVSSTSDPTNGPGIGNDDSRYRLTMHTPIATIKDQENFPVTYLNKGQIYYLSVVDLSPPLISSQSAKYRTSIRVTFDDDLQMLNPSACWQLWEEVRGGKEAQERGSKIQAIDYLYPEAGEASQQRNQIQLESTSLDGFCFTWMADTKTGVPECMIGVRFHFLSTDFTSSKGVKGSSVRLCAKTEMLTSDIEDAGFDNNPEMSYCKVKLFRDHGAERRADNDQTQIEKRIKKLRSELELSETDGDQLENRKRGRVASVSKNASSTMATDGPMQAQDHRDKELQLLQDSLTLNRPMTVLNFRAKQKDDPDLFPLRGPIHWHCPTKSDFGRSSKDSPQSSSIVTRTNSSSPKTMLTAPSSSQSGIAVEHGPPQKSVKVPRALGASTIPSQHSEALEVDRIYKSESLSEHQSRPATCFYIRFHHEWEKQDAYYRALYLTERTVRDLTVKICQKQSLNPASVARMLYANPGGLKVVIDDDVVRQLPDGQDMMVEISRNSVPQIPGTGSDIEIILSY